MSRKETGRSCRTKGGDGSKPLSKDLKSLDAYLEEKHLRRKSTAKDGSCLFRAVAEQVFLAQFYHQKVRGQCVRYIREHQEEFQNFVPMSFDKYLEQLSWELWGGELELVVISKLYTRNVVVYMCNEQDGSVGEKSFGAAKTDNPIRLAYSDGNHYDSVYTDRHMGGMAMCQGIIYTLLYERVLKQKIPPSSKRRLETLREEEISSARKSEPDRQLRNLLSYNTAVSLRAMGSLTYHNAALQIYQSERENIERFDREVASSIQFQIGDRCQFKLPDIGIREGEICALNSSGECHTVYVFAVNEEWEIPIKDISLKHPYTKNGKRNSQQNRSRNRHGNVRTEEMSHRHDNRSSPKSLPLSSNLESWPLPTSTNNRAQPTKSSVTDTTALPPPPGMANPMVTALPVTAQVVSSDKKVDKTWTQKIHPASKQTMSSKGTHPSKSATPLSKTPDTIQHSTKAPPPQHTSIHKPSGTGKTSSGQQTSARPAKVNSASAGSLTSEDYSSSDESTEQTDSGKQAPFAAKPNSDQQSQLHAPPYEGGHPVSAQKGVWPGRPIEIVGKVAPPVAVATLTEPALNGFPNDQGRESPYLIPQLPREASSQPEDDWPSLNSSDSRMLPIMGSHPRGMSPLNIPTDPATLVPGMPLNHQFQMPFGPFGPFPPAMFFQDVSKSNHVPPPSGFATSFPVSAHFPVTFQDQSTTVSSNAQGNQSPTFVVHRTPSSSMTANRAQPQSEPLKSPIARSLNEPSKPPIAKSLSDPVKSPMATSLSESVKSPMARSRQPPAPRKDQSPEPSKPPVKKPQIAASLHQPRQRVVAKATQTTPPPKTESSTQAESLGMTTYTQTPVKTFEEVGVEASVDLTSVSTQVSPKMVDRRVQTSTKVVLASELEPPDLEEDSSPLDKLKFGIQYAIQCLELYNDKAEDERASQILDSLKDFDLERLHIPSLAPLDISQQEFLRSFQFLSQHSPLEGGFFNRSNSQDAAMHTLPRQQELLQPQQQGGGSPPAGSSPPSKEDADHPPSHPHGFPPQPPVPMSNIPPMMMQRPPMMMMPFFPFGGFPMPPFQMMPPQMVHPNMMDPQSPHPGTSHPLVDQEGVGKDSSTPSADNRPKQQSSGMTASHEESRIAESESPPYLVAPSAYTVPSSAYEQPSAVVSSEVKVHTDMDEGQGSGALRSSLSTVAPSDKKPSESPLESSSAMAAVREDSPDSESKLQENHTPVRVDESQNLPNRKGKQSNQQQQRSSRGSRQGRFKSTRKEGQPPEEPHTSKESTDDAEFKKTNSRSSSKGGSRYSFQKGKGASGNRGGNQSRQQQSEQLASDGGQSSRGEQSGQLTRGGQHGQSDESSSREQSSRGGRSGQSESSSREQSSRGGRSGQSSGQSDQSSSRGQSDQSSRSGRFGQPSGQSDESSSRGQSDQSSRGGRSGQSSGQSDESSSRGQSGQSSRSGRSRQSSGQSDQPSSRGQSSRGGPRGGQSGPRGGGQFSKAGTPPHFTQQSGNQSFSKRGRPKEPQASGGPSRKQNSSTQASSSGGGQDSSRSAFPFEHSERHQNDSCTVLQPRAFSGDFPSPNHPASSLEGNYASPQPAVNLPSASSRWKFTSGEGESNNLPHFKLNRDLLDWDSEDPWPDLHGQTPQRAEYSQTVEDPFISFPASQNHWDSDVGDWNVSLTVDPQNNLGSRHCFPPPPHARYNNVNTHTQCVRESKVSSKVDSECVVGN